MEETQTSTMNQKKINLYKEILKDVYVACNGVKNFINERIEEICFHEKLFAEEVIYFVY